MLTLEEAKTLAIASARDQIENKTTELVVFDARTIVKRYGWVLFVNTAALARSGDFIMDALVGLGPIVVRHDGNVHVLSGATPVEESIADLERKHWLRP